MKKLLCCMITILCFVPMIPVRAEGLKLAENAKSAILLEASTGHIIYENNSHEKLAPASMTKMMSMLLIMESIEKGILDWEEEVTVSENASKMGGSQILLETGEKMKVKDLFKGIAVASGNDAVVALAERVAGTEEQFVTMMNHRAKELGLKDTHFKNPHGLDTANHYSSAYDMVMIAKELVKHEKVLEYSSIYEDYLRKGTDKEIWLVNTNKLVKFYQGLDGLKTGYTKEAGYCLTSTAEKNGMRLITVVMGEPDSKTRNAETTEMLDYGFSQYEVEHVLSKDSNLGKIEIEKGKQKYATLVPSEDITLLHKRTEQKKTATYDVQLNKVKAPVKVGDSVGKLNVKVDGKTTQTIDVTIKEEVEKANLWELYLRYVGDMISGNIKLK